MGFGLTLPSPFRARRSARHMKRSSAEMDVFSAMSLYNTVDGDVNSFSDRVGS
jgi:hypothetical protein